MNKCILFHRWDISGVSFLGDGFYICKKCGMGKIEYAAGAYSILSKEEVKNLVNKNRLRLVEKINATIELNNSNSLSQRIPNLAIELLTEAVEELTND